MNDVDRIECEALWKLAIGVFFEQQEKTGDGHGAAIPFLLAAKRRWENAKLDEAAVVADAYPFSAREVAEQIRALKE